MAALPLLPSVLVLLGTQFVAVQTQRDEYSPDTHLSTVSAACHVTSCVTVLVVLTVQVTVCLGAEPISVMTTGVPPLATKRVCLHQKSASVNPGPQKQKGVRQILSFLR